MTTLTIAESLTSDPARFGDDLLANANDPCEVEKAEREVRVTCSSIYRGNRRVIAKMNREGGWSVLVGERYGDAIHLQWSPYTMADDGSVSRYIKRGEAVMTLSHEMFHVLFTGEVIRPEWCKPGHWKEFFTMVNLAEDVRIEDLGEDEVPLFAHLRRVENDRLLATNVGHYASFDTIRQVGIPWFAKRACSTGSEAQFSTLMGKEVARIVSNLYADFDAATRAGSTGELVDLLRPVYEACVPFMSGGGGAGADESEGDSGSSGSSEGQPGANTGDESDTGTSVSGSDDADDDADEDAPSGSSDDGDDGEDGEEQSPESDDASEGDAEGEGDDSDEQSGDSQGSGSGGDGDVPDDLSDRPMRPDGKRGDWSSGERSFDEPDHYDNHTMSTVNGGEINVLSARSRGGTAYDRSSSVAPVAGKVAAQLRRVLQANANGSYTGRRKRGAFDVSSATRIALGDVRIFRKKEGPRGALDFSLVLCLDASSSVTGYVGDTIANAGLAIYEAAERINGLDVALCVYGSRILRTIPFGWDRREGGNPRAYRRMASSVHGGEGGGTGEAGAIVWARAATRNRAAEQGLIVVLTDGAPNNRRAVADQVTAARAEDVMTGGIGVCYDAPNYHQFSASAQSVTYVPGALASLLRTMMSAR